MAVFLQIQSFQGRKTCDAFIPRTISGAIQIKVFQAFQKQNNSHYMTAWSIIQLQRS